MLLAYFHSLIENLNASHSHLDPTPPPMSTAIAWGNDHSYLRGGFEIGEEERIEEV